MPGHARNAIRRNRWLAGALLLFVAATSIAPGAAERDRVGSVDLPEAFADEPAVVLLDSQVWKWRTHEKATLSVHQKVLLRDRRAFDLAERQIIYDDFEHRVSDFQAKTTLPDGKVIEVPDSLIRDTILFDGEETELHALHFTFPGVREGATIEWKFRYTYREPRRQRRWTVQQDIPVLDARFTMDLGSQFAEQVEIHQQLSGPVSTHCTTQREKKRSASKRLDIHCSNLPGLELEPSSPPTADVRGAFDLAWEVRRVADVTAAGWESLSEYLVDGMQTFLNGADFGPFVEAIGLDAMASETQKVDAVYHAVRTLERVDELDTAPTAAELLAAGQARPQDLAWLMVGALREVGLVANFVASPDRRRGAQVFGTDVYFRPYRYYVRATPDGQERLLDPACDHCPPGIPDWRYLNDGYVSLVLPAYAGRAAKIGTLPAEASVETRREMFDVEPDGTASVSGSVSYTGHTGVDYRERWADLSDSLRQDDFLSQLPRHFEGATLEFDGVEDVSTPLRVTYRVGAVQLPTTQDRRLFLQPPETIARTLPIPLQEERRQAIWLRYRNMRRMEAVFELPPGARVVELPEDVRLRAIGLEFRSGWQVEGSGPQLVWRGRFVSRKVLLEPEDYEEVRAFARQVRRALRSGVAIALPGADRASR